MCQGLWAGMMIDSLGFATSLVPQVPKCDFKHSRSSTMYIAMFFADITLFYLIPLVTSVVLYSLIAIMLLVKAPRLLREGNNNNQARLQVDILQ